MKIKKFQERRKKQIRTVKIAKGPKKTAKDTTAKLEKKTAPKKVAVKVSKPIKK